MPYLNESMVKDAADVALGNSVTRMNGVYNKFGMVPPVLTPNDEDSTTGYNHSVEGLELNIYYFHPDHLGSSAYISNASGNASQHMEYLPFGETLVDEHLNSFSSPFKYNGKELDEETGNYYYGARYYDPKWSIFISVDPLAEKTMDAYGYCYQNPIRFVDPTGMAPDNDYGIDKKTGKITLLRTNNDSTDRLIGLNKKGEETNTIVENIAPGILKDGMNFKENHNLIKVGGVGEPTEDQFKEFIVNYSNYFAHVEISGYGVGYGVRSDEINAYVVEAHKNNTRTTSESYRFNKDVPLSSYRVFSHLYDGKNSLRAKKHFHTHPRIGDDITIQVPMILEMLIKEILIITYIFGMIKEELLRIKFTRDIH